MGGRGQTEGGNGAEVVQRLRARSLHSSDPQADTKASPQEQLSPRGMIVANQLWWFQLSQGSVIVGWTSQGLRYAAWHGVEILSELVPGCSAPGCLNQSFM